MTPRTCLPAQIVAITICMAATLAAAPPRILPDGKLPADRRLEPLKDLNGYFPFNVSESRQEWNKRAERVRRRMLVSQGLWPLPKRHALNAVVHGRIEFDDYTVEKAYFESWPGFFVTGNLYRPKGRAGKVPGVLCPHGHWANGRFHDAGEAKAAGELKIKAEWSAEVARSPLQARCVHLARLGCVVFHYDMIGYADNTQISFQLAHRFAKQRAEMNSRKSWGLFSPQAESQLQSVMGLQTWNSIRALDFIESLPDVDPSRIGVTGASGGGTQTFMVCAVDSRPAVSFPAVMVSTAMQGGCTCENASCLRIGTGNVEFAALFGPKPLSLTAADDWTVQMATKGFPELSQHYALLGTANHVKLAPYTQFRHNYNHPSRQAMYRWMNEHLKLGHDDPTVEREFRRLSTEELTVWDDQHPRPEGGEKFERKLLEKWHEDSQKQIDGTGSSWNDWRDMVGGGVDILIGRGLPDAVDVEYDQTDKTDEGSYLRIVGLLRNKPAGEELPIVFLYPKEWEGKAVVWLDERGKAGLYGDDGRLVPAVRRLLEAGASVVGVDLLYQGEFLADGKPVETTRRVANTREAACYTFGYNHSLFARRVHDVLTVLSFVLNHEYEPDEVDLVGLDGVTGPLAIAARAQARDAVDRLAVDTAGFRFAGVDRIHDPRFLPGGAKYGDLPGMISLSAPDGTWIAGEGKHVPPRVAAIYKLAGALENVTVHNGPAKGQTDAAVSWLLDK